MQEKTYTEIQVGQKYLNLEDRSVIVIRNKSDEPERGDWKFYWESEVGYTGKRHPAYRSGTYTSYIFEEELRLNYRIVEHTDQIVIPEFLYERTLKMKEAYL